MGVITKRKKVFTPPSAYQQAHTPWTPKFTRHDGYIVVRAPGGREVTLPCKSDQEPGHVIHDWALGRGWKAVDGGWVEVEA